MRGVRPNPVKNAPWGRKRYYAPLPVLSVLLLTTALAAPDLLHTSFLLFQDSGLTIMARVQQVVHLSGPTGKILGIMTVTNRHPNGLRIAAITATLSRLPPASSITLTINIAPDRFPIDIAAGKTLNIQFSGPFSGDLTSLASGQQFSVAPSISWFGLEPSGVVGPFSYTQSKTCTIPSSIVVNPLGGEWSTVCA